MSATAGPALGGLLVSAVGGRARGLLREVIEGVRWSYRGFGLLALALSNHAWFVGHAVVGVVLAPYVLRTLDHSAFQFGIIGAAGGAGAVLGATVTSRVGRRLGTGRTIIVCRIVTALGVVAMVLAGQDIAPAGQSPSSWSDNTFTVWRWG